MPGHCHGPHAWPGPTRRRRLWRQWPVGSGLQRQTLFVRLVTDEENRRSGSLPRSHRVLRDGVVERRRGGETGVAAVQGLEGDASVPGQHQRASLVGLIGPRRRAADDAAACNREVSVSLRLGAIGCPLDRSSRLESRSGSRWSGSRCHPHSLIYSRPVCWPGCSGRSSSAIPLTFSPAATPRCSSP